MSNDFIEIAQRISDMISSGEVHLEELYHIASRYGQVNFYPGNPSKHCYPTAIFVSISGISAKGRHLSFPQMLKACKKHIQKSCPNQTNDLIIITNDWLTGKFEEIYNYLESARNNGANVEIYFIAGKRKVLHMGL